MAKKQILDKLARNAEMLGLTVNSRGASGSFVVENASNDLTVDYVDASIASPMGGVSDAAAPFLGIGIANPGKIRIKSAISTADTIADVLDSAVAAKVLAMCAALANNIVLENSDAAFSLELRGNPDHIGLGQ